MNWQSIFKDNKQHMFFVGLTQRVFRDMMTKVQYHYKPANKSFIQFKVKLFDIKFFLDAAIWHASYAIKRQE